MKNKKDITAVSLFSGAGGMDLGIMQAGIKIIWAVDNDPDCVQTYKENIGDHIVCSDISNISSADIPKADIVIGGFPCQGFSVANRFRSSDDSRNKLYIEMLRVIRDVKPKWFIAENVKGILSLENGKVFETILADFKEAGYRVRYELVNMADHGVPQLRKRVVILGTRLDLSSKMDLYHPSADHDKFGTNGKNKWISIQTALDSLKNYKNSFPNNMGSKYKVEFRNFTGHRQTNKDLPSPTILARGNGKGGVCAIPHPNGDRRLTVRESALIQTFPINFEFFGSINSMYRQIGNAVPVLYAKKIGTSIMKLYEYEKN